VLDLGVPVLETTVNRGPRGCRYCPLNQVPGIKKILGLDRIRGRPIMIWAMCPGREENSKGLELVGPSGQLLWKALRRYGVTRDHVDVQNVVRCWPADSSGVDHTPTAQELYCCSIYNVEALERNQGRARVHLILGEVAAKQLLGPRYRKDKAVIWVDEWDAYAVLAAHPSYLLRANATSSTDRIYQRWCKRLRAAKLLSQHPGRYGYIKAQDYGAVCTADELRKLCKVLRAQAEAGRRISFDVEDDTIDGRRIILSIGFGWGHYDENGRWQGGARSVILYHPEADQDPKRIQPLVEGIRSILEDDSIRKVAQHGSYDVKQLRELLDIRVRGYDYDSQYAAYLYDSGLRTYGLDAQAQRDYPEFADYKELVAPYDWHLAKTPLADLVLYNCADCDLTKRIEVDTAPHISLPLLQVYIAVAFVLDGMEQRGPYVDWEHYQAVSQAVDPLLDETRRKLQHIAEDPEFNPDSPHQVSWLLYEKLKLPDISGTKSTDADVLRLLATQVSSKALQLVLTYRKLSRMKSTYLEGAAVSARMHGGQARTIWWLTGAVTGRLRSGRGDSAMAQGVMNFQNLHGNPLLQNLFVSDPNWRIVLQDPESALDKHVFLSLDYSQIEVRMMAEVSGDPLLIRQFREAGWDAEKAKLEGKDIHCQVGHILTGWPIEQIAKDKETRRAVKIFHWQLIYGASKESLYQRLRMENVDITPERVSEYYDRYFQRYKGVARYIREQRRRAEQFGYVETLFGFRRYIGQDEMRSTYWANQAINSPIQGTAHQLVLIAMALLHKKPKTYHLLQMPIMEVHDALVFVVPTKDLPEAYQQAKQLLQHDVADYCWRHFRRRLRVPLVAEATAGYCLGTMLEYHGEPVSEFIPKWVQAYQDRGAVTLDKFVE